MAQPRSRQGAPRVRHVHLGDRLLAVGRVRSGLATVEEVAAELDVARDDVNEWLLRHAGERTLTLDELRAQGSPEMLRLARRAQRLAALVAEAERDLRALHQELMRGLAASNEPFAASNNFDENPHARAPRVAAMQPACSNACKSVDAKTTR